MGIICISEPGEPLRYARHPLVYLVEAADDICYEIMDLEDAHKLKILSFEETTNILLSFFGDDIRQSILNRIVEEGLTDNNEKIVYMRACVIGLLESECVKIFCNNEQDILNGTFEGSLIDHISPAPCKAYKDCASMSAKRIYKSRPVLDVELSGYKIMETLMAHFIEAARHRLPKSGDSSDGSHRLYQRHDRRLCIRCLSEDLRYLSTNRIEKISPCAPYR